MYNNMVEKLIKQKEEIENLIKNYQAPVNNFINTTQTPSKDLLEWRVLNENDEVDNLYVSNKTLFINDNMMVLKGVDGKLEKWEIKKIYPVDKKDEKITQLEEEIKQLKEMIKNEYAESTSTTRGIKQPNELDDVNVESKSKTSSKSVSK